MKKVRIACLLIALGIVIWSVWTDVMTYNVYFQTDKNIVLYCIDGIVFNAPKIFLPIAVAITTFIYDLYEHFANAKQDADRADRC